MTFDRLAIVSSDDSYFPAHARLGTTTSGLLEDGYVLFAGDLPVVKFSSLEVSL
jgi:hypothetical protein